MKRMGSASTREIITDLKSGKCVMMLDSDMTLMIAYQDDPDAISLVYPGIQQTAFILSWLGAEGVAVGMQESTMQRLSEQLGMNENVEGFTAREAPMTVPNAS